MKLSLIIPCFNEQECLNAFYNEAIKVVKDLDCEYEMIFVDDGSTDSTLTLLKKLAGKDKGVIYLSFSRNFGKEAAMYAGFSNATGDYVAVMDADLQDPPALLKEMVDILDSGEYDSVATRRVTRKGEPPIRSWFARRFYKFINKVSDADIVDGARDFRLMKKEMVDAILAMSENGRFSKGIFGWIGFRTYWLPYENVERIAGNTKWSFTSLLKYALDGIMMFSSAPISAVFWLGVILFILSIICLLMLSILKFACGIIISDSLFIVSAILLIGAIQTICLGIIGKYIDKTYTETKNRPHYIISQSNKKDVNKIN